MFDESRLDPKKVEEAKKIAAGPLGAQMAKFPLKFATAMYYGKLPIKNPNTDLRNGTAAIIDFGNGPMIVSAQHVIQGYRDWIEKEKNIVFQVGNLKIDPIPRIVYESKKYDLVVIKIEGKERKEIPSPGQVEEIGKEAYTIQSWPPPIPTDKDWVAFGGFPGNWRQYPSDTEIIFDSFSSGSCPITSVSEDHFVCHFEKERWVKSLDLYNHEELYNLGGLSGSPVFLIENIQKRGLINFVFIGIVYEFNSALDLMCVRLAKFLKWGQ